MPGPQDAAYRIPHWTSTGPALLWLTLALNAPAAAATVSPDRTEAARQLQAAEAARLAHLAESARAGHALALAQGEAAKLASERVEAAAALRLIEAGVLDAAGRLHAAQDHVAQAEAALGRRQADFLRIMPVMLLMARFPAETTLAVPLPHDRALLGLLITRGLARQLQQEAAAIRTDEAEAVALRADMEAQATSLAAERARQAAAAAALDRDIARAKFGLSEAERAAQAADEQAAALAARANSLREAIAAIDASRAGSSARAEAEARLQGRLRGPAADAAKARAAALTRPFGPGIEAPGQALPGQARLESPVAGPILRPWGTPTEDGPATGVTFGTAPGAFVSSPCTGRVGFAAPFRGYDRLMIIECGGGYDVVLAGLASLAASVGRSVRAGEPVGRMPDFNVAKTTERPGLYMELRSSGAPKDPAPFLDARG
jgi:septal ring factor EnvC (AmiA/AmiB activator)